MCQPTKKFRNLRSGLSHKLWTPNNNADPAVTCRHKQDGLRSADHSSGMPEALICFGRFLQKGHLLLLWENQESMLTAMPCTHGGSAHWKPLKIILSIQGNSLDHTKKHKPKTTHPVNNDSKVKLWVQPNPGTDPNQIFSAIYVKTLQFSVPNKYHSVDNK